MTKYVDVTKYVTIKSKKLNIPKQIKDLYWDTLEFNKGSDVCDYIRVYLVEDEAGEQSYSVLVDDSVPLYLYEELQQKKNEFQLFMMKKGWNYNE